MCFLCIYLSAALLYALFTGWLLVGLGRLRRPLTQCLQPTVSVVIPARNEAKTLDRCLTALQQQTYPDHLYEIIVVDDESSDDTRQIALQHGVRYFFSAVTANGWSPKKEALRRGIHESRGEIILTTDADCTVPAEWIETMMCHFLPNVGAVASWVDVQPNGSLRAKIEALDAWSLQIIGAAAIGHGRPFLANGANWGYRRQVYEHVQGFTGIERAASGDDDLLLQKMTSRCPQRVAFVDAPGCRVVTQPCESWSAFIKQRLRWASKIKQYPAAVIGFEAFIFFYHASLLWLFFLSLTRPAWLGFILCKIFCDLTIMLSADRRFLHRHRWYHFLAAEWWQVLYTVFIGLFAWRGRFVWKDRRYHRGVLTDEKRI